MGGATSGLMQKVSGLAGLFKSFGKGGVIGIAIAAFTGLIKAAQDGIKNSTKNTIEWKAQLEAMKPIADWFHKKNKAFAAQVLELTQSIEALFAMIFGGQKGYEKYHENRKEATKQLTEEYNNQREIANLQILEVSAQTRLNELKGIAADTDKYSYKQRKEALEEIDAIEQSLENRKVAAAKEAWELEKKRQEGEVTTAKDLEKIGQLYMNYLNAQADATANEIAREKELYQLQKDAGEEALDYRIRILESERNLLNTRISMVEANTIEEYNLRRAVADKEYEIAVATADKEKKNMTLKNQQLLEAQLNYQRDLQQIEDDFTAGYIQRIKDQTDTAVATTVDEWKKSLPKLQGLMEEYKAKLQGGKPATQTTDEWLKELAVLREAMRKTYLGGLQDAFEKIDENIKLKLQDTFNVWEQGTAKYMYAEIQQFQHMYDVLALERETVLADAKQMEYESDEEFAARRAEIEKFYDLQIIEARKKIVEDYQKWYYQSVKETDTEVILSSKKLYEDYVNGIPHSVWDYMFKPTDNTMDQLQTNLDNAKSRFEAAKRSIEVMFVDLWDEETMGKFDFNKAFDLLPDDIQKDYLAKLEDYKDKEQVILKQRLDN